MKYILRTFAPKGDYFVTWLGFQTMDFNQAAKFTNNDTAKRHLESAKGIDNMGWFVSKYDEETGLIDNHHKPYTDVVGKERGVKRYV